jgi:diaminopimelate decarboxylase
MMPQTRTPYYLIDEAQLQKKSRNHPVRARAIRRKISPGAFPMMIAGRTCLAGDLFGSYELEAPLKIDDEVRFADAAGYTMVKKNWFNGVAMPSIVVRRLDGTIELVRSFDYNDYINCLL